MWGAIPVARDQPPGTSRAREVLAWCDGGVTRSAGLPSRLA